MDANPAAQIAKLPTVWSDAKPSLRLILDMRGLMTSPPRTYTAICTPAGEPGWWSVHLREEPGVITQAPSLEQVEERIREALAAWLDDDDQAARARIEVIRP